jgi:DNA primase
VIRHAITLVLNEPQSCLQLDVEKLAGLKRPGAELLRILIETVQAEPTITTAGILERYRHHDEGRHLGKLVASEMPLDEEFDAAAELAECLEQLALAGRKERVDFLIEKQRVSGLSDDEKTELRQLH